MMRSGRLLTEDSPDDLLRHYNLSSLENVFLKLCMNDEGKSQIEQRSEPLANAVMGCTATRAQQHPIGHDNMAYDRSASQSDVSEIGIDCQYNKNGNRSLNNNSVVRNFVIISIALQKKSLYYSVHNKISFFF